MRGALGPRAREVRRFYHVPASSTAVGHIVLEAVDGNGRNPGARPKVLAQRGKTRTKISAPRG